MKKLLPGQCTFDEAMSKAVTSLCNDAVEAMRDEDKAHRQYEKDVAERKRREKNS